MDVTLTAESGRELGTRSSKRLRAAGKIPGVVYGLGSEPVAVAVDWPDLRKVLTTAAGLNALIALTVDGQSNLSMVKDLQRDPVRHDVLHVDFQLIDREAALSVEVPLVLVGRAEKLEHMNGIVDQLRYMLMIKAKPGFIPTQLEADISELELGDSITVADIALPDGVECELDGDITIAMGSATRSTLPAEGGLAAEGEEGEGGEGGEGASDESGAGGGGG